MVQVVLAKHDYDPNSNHPIPALLPIGGKDGHAAIGMRSRKQ